MQYQKVFFSTEGVRRDTSEKPPIGIIPKGIHDRSRAVDIINAVQRYVQAGKSVPIAWIEELKVLICKDGCWAD